jgi:nuclear pore complex protein Nup155
MLKLRPVDLLRQLLVENRGPEAEAVKLFFQTQKEEQACATSLILACLQSTQNLQVAEWATRAFFLYGGEPKIRVVATPVASPSLQYSLASGGEILSIALLQLYLRAAYQYRCMYSTGCLK